MLPQKVREGIDSKKLLKSDSMKSMAHWAALGDTAVTCLAHGAGIQWQAGCMGEEIKFCEASKKEYLEVFDL